MSAAVISLNRHLRPDGPPATVEYRLNAPIRRCYNGALHGLSNQFLGGIFETLAGLGRKHMSSQKWIACIGVFLATGALLIAAFGPVNRDGDSGTDRASSPTPENTSPQPDASSNRDDDRTEAETLIVDEPAPAPEGMAWIPGGTFEMGNNDGPPDESPRHSVSLDGFWMDATEVTNAQFQQFVDATGYVTIAETTPKREDFIDQLPDVSVIPEENLVASSICFNKEFDREALRTDFALWPYQVWQAVKGASWRHPEGPDSSIEDRMDHPVVHVAWDDVMAYCKWVGKRLPTEAEWEYAARGGLIGKTYPWGDERNPDGKWLHNIWQGEFPFENKVLDGHEITSPVGSFSPNGYGLHDMSGNAWEWCLDFYRPDYYAKSPQRNPFGPKDSFDPQEPRMAKRVQRGGSFMCNANYCIGYRVAARMKGTPDSGAFHTGFRCVLTTGMRDAFDKAPARKVADTETSSAGS